MNQIYKIQGMHCQSCVAKIKTALEPLTASIEVTFNPPEAKLMAKKNISLQTLNDQLATIGDYRLIPAKDSQPVTPSKLKQYYPLILILLYVLSVSLLNQDKMLTFMAGFFLVFSGFKLLDLPGFANAYATYDLLAKRWHAYGFIYPFLELGLGFAYLTHFQPRVTYSITIILMGFSSLGVIKALANKQKIQCACLGTVLNLPMTAVTLIEDFLMVAMAIVMLLNL